MAVVATAGHVDHGKSALVRAITGTDPDRLPEERRRGMTIELGHVWADLDGRRVAVVDVPGHDRLVGTTLAGLGPVAGVLLVVAADEGWRAQTEEHVAAVRALGLTDVALVVTRADLADPGPATADALARLAAHGIRPVAVAAASARTGAGLADVRAALAALVDRAPVGDPDAPVRLWVDRSFSVTGSGTVVTGTLPTGTVARGDTLVVGGAPVRVRGLQVHGEPVEAAAGPTRLAVNLRAVPTTAVPRGSALLSPGWPAPTRVVDVALHRLTDRMPSHATLHVGTASGPVRVRPLGADHARLSLADGFDALPLVAGDRVVLRDPGAHEVLAGATVLDPHPPPLTRRGDAARRADALASGHPWPSPAEGAPPRGPAPVRGRGDDPVRTRVTGCGRRDPASAALAALLAWLDAHPLEPAPAELLAPVSRGGARRRRARRRRRAARWAGAAGNHARGGGPAALGAGRPLHRRRRRAGAGHEPAGRHPRARTARRAGGDDPPRRRHPHPAPALSGPVE